MKPPPLPEPAAVSRAFQSIGDRVHRTPVISSESLDRMLGCRLVFKCEHLQHTGSFKFRGATHAVLGLPSDCPGVATHSSGNHGAALAAAARARGLEAHVVMPENAVATKIEAVGHYGGTVHPCAPTQEAREAGLQTLVERGLVAIPPYDDERIIAGQGTAGLELMEQAQDLDLVLAPVGGGGLISGLALAADGALPVLGAEPLGADDTIRSLAAGKRVSDHHPKTIADGLRALVGVRNLAIISQRVEQVLGVSEEAIVRAMDLIASRADQRVEPSGAVALAAVMEHPRRFAGQTVGVILSGGNMDRPAQSEDQGSS